MNIIICQLTSFSQLVLYVTHIKMIVCIIVPPIIPDHMPYTHNTQLYIQMDKVFSFLLDSSFLYFFLFCFVFNQKEFLFSLEIKSYFSKCVNKNKLQYLNKWVYVDLSTKIKFKAKKATQWNSNHIVTSHIDICHKSLPSTPNSHTFNSNFKKLQ